jgi:hypothetical protein
MGKKKTQVMKEQESGSFLAAEKQPIASPAPDVSGIQRTEQLIKIQKKEIVDSIQINVQEIVIEIVKEVGYQNKAAIVLEAILRIYDIQERVNWLFEYKKADKSKRKEMINQLLVKFFQS